MQYKPWPLIVISIFHLVEPITKIVFYSLLLQVSPVVVIKTEASTGNWLHLFEFFFLFPIAGFAIYKVKKWSLPVFLFVEAWVFSANWESLHNMAINNNYLLLSFFVAFGLLNFFVVIYFLMPTVRLAYLNPRIRWWEASPRYSLNINCKLDGKDEGRLLNISQSGVFIKSDKKWPLDSTSKLSFTYKDKSFTSDVRIVHSFNLDGHDGHGMQFLGTNRENKKTIKSLMAYLEKNNYDRRPPRRNLTEDFKKWAWILVKTGKGLFPERR